MAARTLGCSTRARCGALVGGLVLAAFGSVPGAAEKPVTHTVVIDGLRFAPASLDARVGDTIVWKNNDPFAHTVTARSGLFDSGELAAGGSWSYRATSSGAVDYFCRLHPTMKAALQVK